MVLTRYCPWKEHLLELEEEMGITGELKYVLYAEGDPAGKWRIQVWWMCGGLEIDFLGCHVACRIVEISGKNGPNRPERR